MALPEERTLVDFSTGGSRLQVGSGSLSRFLAALFP